MGPRSQRRLIESALRLGSISVASLRPQCGKIVEKQIHNLATKFYATTDRTSWSGDEHGVAPCMHLSENVRSYVELH